MAFTITKNTSTGFSITLGGGSSNGQMKVYTGSSWAAKPVKVWTGSAWVTKPAKVWNGSAWIITDY